MKRLILFRFHKKPEICCQRIKNLKKYNPNTKIIGLGDKIDGLDKMFDSGMDSFYSLDHKEDRWCWLNGDLAMREWYINEGKNYDFDMLHLIEWDLVLRKSLDELYKGIDEIGLTGKIEIEKAKNKGWSWALSDDYKYLRKKLDSESKQVYACILPGCCFSKEFLEDFSSIEVPELCNDEARLGILSADYDVSKTGFFDWSKTRDPLFNSNNITPSREDLKKSNREVFHPVRFKI